MMSIVLDGMKLKKWHVRYPEEAFERITVADRKGGFYSRSHVVAQVSKRHPKTELNVALIENAPDMLKALFKCYNEMLVRGCSKKELDYAGRILRRFSGLV